MARKGFWNKLFGGDDAPEDRPDENNDAASPEEVPAKPDESALDANDPPSHEPLAHDPPADQPGAETEPHPAPESPEPTPAREEVADDGPTRDATNATDTPAPAPPAQADPDPGDFPLSQTAELKTDAVGRVYAEALLDLARESGEQDAIADEVRDLLPLVEPGSDLERLVTNPAISSDERSKIVARVFEGKVSDLLLRLLKVVADKNRLGSLHSILSGYLLAVAGAEGQVEVDAYVATEMDGPTADRVAQRIAESLGSKRVSLRQHVDPSLIGGLKIKIGDKLIDASVASQLRAMKQKMIAGRAN